MIRNLLFLLLLSLMALPTLAQTATWTGNADSDWNNAANWNPAATPTTTSDVVIATGGANQPNIGASVAGVAKSVEVQAGAVLTIVNSGSLSVNGSKTLVGLASTSAFQNRGTVQNSGQLVIGNTAPVGNYGLYNTATFNNNTGGSLAIDRSTSSGLYNNAGGNFTNVASIIIGGQEALLLQYGLTNANASFSNNTGGTIAIDRTRDIGLFNHVNSSFTNAAVITIGRMASVGLVGLYNLASFINNTGGSLAIDRSSNTGLINDTGSLTNAGAITIGAVASVGTNGLQSNATFNNNAGGTLAIDRSTSTGLFNAGGSFTNAATITIGRLAAVGGTGLKNRATFRNRRCAILTLFAPLANSSPRLTK